MKHLILCAALLLPPLPATAQEGTGKGDEPSLMTRGLMLFFEGLTQEMEPALKELQDIAPKVENLLSDMGPAVRDLLSTVDDLSLYEAPEILPNGDIIMRRKIDAPPLEADEFDI